MLHSNNSCVCIEEVDQMIDQGMFCFLFRCGDKNVTSGNTIVETEVFSVFPPPRSPPCRVCLFLKLIAVDWRPLKETWNNDILSNVSRQKAGKSAATALHWYLTQLYLLCITGVIVTTYCQINYLSHPCVYIYYTIYPNNILWSVDQCFSLELECLNTCNL